MTVCIGVLSGRSSRAPRVFLASDRLISARDVQFEPDAPKVERLTASIVVCIAGNVHVHTAVGIDARSELQRRITAEPEVWRTVQEAAELYRDKFVEWRRRDVQQRVLEPFALTWESFLEMGSRLEKGLFDSLCQSVATLATEHDGQFAAIVAGIDGTEGDEQAHLFTVRGGQVTCEDRMGFAAIGIGEDHASSQLMLRGYNANRNSAEALVALGIAKRAAEVAPGVGRATDRWVIGPSLGSAFPLRDDVERMLDQALNVRATSVAAADKAIAREVEEGLDRLLVAPPKTDQSETSSPTEPGDT